MLEFKKIGRYIVENLLGEGAMGSVFKAHDPFIKRTVAIKIVKLDASANPEEANEFLERFKQEAQISGHLNHPNIVAVYDVGEQEGMPYIAMEYVEGQTLSNYIHSDPAPAMSDRMKVLTHLSGALDFAHAKGIVHRDLKPANILVQTNGEPKIMDFGIAKMSGSNLTQTGVFLGTPSYSSPEQIKEGHVDFRSDIFSLGILSHETITGTLPFPGKSINAILYKIANEPPKLCEDLSGQPVRLSVFREVMTRALDKNPDKRYQKASEFTTALLRSLKLSQAEATVVGTVMTRMDDRVRDEAGIRKDLKRSEFEQSVHRPVNPKPEPKKSGMGRLIAAVIVVAALGSVLYLHMTDKLMPFVDDMKVMFGKMEEELPIGTKPETVAKDGTAVREETAPPAEPTTIQRAFSVNSTPIGAKVTFDGKSLGETPLSYTWEGKPGTVAKLELSARGRESKSEEITLSEDLSGAFSYNLPAIKVKRTISANPSGSLVSVDGKTAVKAPYEFSFEDGKKYRIQVTREGYKPRAFVFTEGKSKPDQLKVTLEKLPPPGILTVESWLEDLEILVDGKRRRGEKIKLAAGTYKLRLRSQKFFYDEQQSITVKEGETVALSTPDLVTVSRVDFIGGYVNVRINGTDVKNGDALDTTPMVNLRIVKGRHEFSFIDPQSGEVVIKKSIEVSNGEPIIVSSGD